MRVAGIDPGQSGGLVLLSDDEQYGQLMPVRGAKKEIDGLAVMKWLFLAEPDLVIVEKVGARPASYTTTTGKVIKTQGIVSTFNFGMGYGVVQGVLQSLAIPYKLIRPQTWKAHVLPAGDHDKKAAIAFTQNNYPGIDLIPGRCRVPQDGIADAACLAHYGRLRHDPDYRGL